MRKTKTITVGDPPREITAKELVFGGIRQLLPEFKKLAAKGDIQEEDILNLLAGKIHLLSDVEKVEDIDDLTLVEIREFLAALTEVNQSFLEISGIAAGQKVTASLPGTATESQQ